MFDTAYTSPIVSSLAFGAFGSSAKRTTARPAHKQGNASADVARTYLLFCLAGDTEAAELYLGTFCKKSDTAKQYVQKWMPIVAASQSVKGNESEREFLLTWTNVVDYE